MANPPLPVPGPAPEVRLGSAWPSPPPSVGRIVHYHALASDGVSVLCCAALIISVPVSDTGTTVGLLVFRPDGTQFATGADLNPGNTPNPGSWHWPERV